jgi:hypothetical protein
MKLLCLRNIRFFKDGHFISAPSAELESADCIGVTFKMQENDQKTDTVIHGRTYNATLCPVLQLARVVNQIWTYQGTIPDTPVCAVRHHDRLENIT